MGTRITALLSALLFAALAGGCATSTASSTRAGEDASAPLLGDLPTPETGPMAQAYLAGAAEAMRAGQPQQALQFLSAILRSDHLTERGRANVYWLVSEAERARGDERGLTDALGGFLVAAEVLPPDDELRAREVEARSTLLARKVKSTALFGKSPESAIVVEDARDAPGVVAELGCVEDAVSSSGSPSGQKLEQRRVICSAGSGLAGDSLVLWFDVTQAR